MPHTRQKICWGSGLAVGVLLVAIGILALTLVQSVINNQVLERDYLGYDKTDSKKLNDMTLKWVKPAYDMRLSIYMYSLTNEENVMKNGAKPHLEQIGPFVFIEEQEKRTHVFTNNYTRVIYKNNHLYYFNRTLSCDKCSLDRKITIPNVIFQKLVDAAMTSGIYKFAVEAVLVAEKQESAFITVTVGEALFEGYEDPLLSAVCKNLVLRKLICEGMKIPDRIGFFYGQNNTNDGAYEIHTGLNDPYSIGKMFSWNNMTRLPGKIWDSPYAQTVNGTDGQLFSPMMKKEDKLILWAAQICRSVSLVYGHDSTYRDIAAWRYVVPGDMYDMSIPENKMYCNKEKTPRFFENRTIQSEGCLPAGLLDISRCQPGEPRIYLSKGHFLDAPKEVFNAVDGLAQPSDENDSTYVEIEPTSGVPINAKRLMQINVGMLKGNLDVLAKTSNVIMPVLWLNETAWVDAATRDQLLHQLIDTKRTAFVSGIVLLTIGALMVFATLVVIVVYGIIMPSNGNEHTILQNEDDNDDIDVLAPAPTEP